MLRAMLAAYSDQLGKEWFDALAENPLEAEAMYENNRAVNGHR